MSKTAEELAHSIATTIWNDFIARPYNAGTPYNFSFKQLKQVIQKEVSNSRQSEIDELTKEVDATFHELEGYKEHNKQLQEEVERLRKEREIEKMQIMGRQKGLIYYPNYVSFNLMSEEMAQKNHGQSLRTLNSRGGMSVMEILANIKNDRIVKGVETQDDINELNKLILNYPLPPINQ